MRLVDGVIIAALLVISNQEATGRSVRCDGNLVMPGDYQADVFKKCGEPDHVATGKISPDTWVSMHYDYPDERFKAPYLLKGPIQEVWTYQFGPNRLPYHLHFQNGRLTHLETGQRHN